MKTVATLAVGLLLSGDGPVAGAPQPCPSIASVSAKLLIERTCAELRERLATVRGATVSKAGSAFLDPRLGCTRMGCVVKLQGTFKGLRGAAPPDEWLRGEYSLARDGGR
jgi:hypothetical protein